MSQEEVANQLSIKAPVIGRYERDKAKPNIEAAARMASLLEVSLDDLVKGKDDPLKEVEVKDKSLMSKIQMIDQLPTEEKETVLKVIDMALTKMKMKDFFQQQLAQ